MEGDSSSIAYSPPEAPRVGGGGLFYTGRSSCILESRHRWEVKYLSARWTQRILTWKGLGDPRVWVEMGSGV
jgi:hypothetical protein